MRYRYSLLVRARFKVSGSLEPIPVEREGVPDGAGRYGFSDSGPPGG